MNIVENILKYFKVLHRFSAITYSLYGTRDIVHIHARTLTYDINIEQFVEHKFEQCLFSYEVQVEKEHTYSLYDIV